MPVQQLAKVYWPDQHAGLPAVPACVAWARSGLRVIPQPPRVRVGRGDAIEKGCSTRAEGGGLRDAPGTSS